jgi:hypothetical protein
VKLPLQLQWQPLVRSPCTVAAWPLQSTALVHVTPQTGKLARPAAQLSQLLPLKA